MKEKVLHQWWKEKNIDFRTFKAADKSIQILDFGEYNRFENGPDFIGAKIRIDTIIWCGSVEIHTKASDWNKHGHQKDNTFNNVILHVVQHKDKDVYNAQNELVRTIEVNPFSKNHPKQWIACEKSIYLVDNLTLVRELENSLIDRLNRKAGLINTHQTIYQFDYRAVFTMLLFRAFGNKVNQHFFEQLFLQAYLYLNRVKDDLQVFLFGLAGFELTAQQQETWNYLQQKLALTQMPSIRWRTKGFYAGSSPVFRLKQLIEILHILHNIDIFQMSVADWCTLRLTLIKQKVISRKQVDLLYINAVALFYWWFEQYVGNGSYRERAIDLLLKLPPEENNILKMWKKQDIIPKSAFDSQALLELKNQKCTFTKCLECKIGKTLL